MTTNRTPRAGRAAVASASVAAFVIGLSVVAFAGFVAAWPGVARAHHAWNEIDTTTTFELTGVVTSLRWENPHASLTLRTDDAGRPIDWTVMMSGIARNESHGVTQELVGIGRPLVVVASPARDQPRTVRADRIRSDGREYVLD